MTIAENAGSVADAVERPVAADATLGERPAGDVPTPSPPSLSWAKHLKTAGCAAQDGSCELHVRQRVLRLPSAGKSLAEATPEVAALLDADASGFSAAEISFGSSTVLGVWRCKQSGHTWCAPPNTLTNARHPSGCSICAGKIVIPTTSLAAVAPWLEEQWDVEANGGLTASQVAPNDNRTYWWTCRVAADHNWKASPNNRYGRGSGCPMCSGQKASSTNNLTLSPLLMAQWDWPKNTQRGLQPGELTQGSKVVADWVCATYLEHKWGSTVSHRTSGRTCPYCSRNRVSELNSLASVASQLAEQFDCVRNKTTPDLVAASSNTRYWWICPVEPGQHPGWKAQPNNRIAGQGCPDCVTPGSSAQEIRLAHEIASVIPFDVSAHSVKLGSGKSIKVDMLIKNLRLAVEFDGSYWHRDIVERDTEKTRLLRKEGWGVVRIREAPLKPIDTEWDVQIPMLAAPYVAACAVLEHLVQLDSTHLVRLGLGDTGKVAAYLQRGLPAAAQEAERALVILRQRAETSALK